jgi:hypothetical protein
MKKRILACLTLQGLSLATMLVVDRCGIVSSENVCGWVLFGPSVSTSLLMVSSRNVARSIVASLIAFLSIVGWVRWEEGLSISDEHVPVYLWDNVAVVSFVAFCARSNVRKGLSVLVFVGAVANVSIIVFLNFIVPAQVVLSGASGVRMWCVAVAAVQSVSLLCICACLVDPGLYSVPRARSLSSRR